MTEPVSSGAAAPSGPDAQPRDAGGPAAGLSVNAGAVPLFERLVAHAGRLRVGVEQLPGGVTLVDAGIDVRGSIEAGLLIARIAMGGLGHVELVPHDGPDDAARIGWLSEVSVRSSQPVLACLASQYAGWSLTHGEGKGGFHAMGSGPARALAIKEPLFADLKYRDRCDRAVLVLEVDRRPPPQVLDKVVRDCGIDASRLGVVLTPTTSLAGNVQIVARVLEVALHKAHSLRFPLHAIVDGIASAPLPPPSSDFLTSMSRTNDAILFAGSVHLFVDAPDEAASRLAQQLPSSSSRDYGRTFGEIFKQCGYDFYRIDPMLFAPARVRVTSLHSGVTFAAGLRDDAALVRAFGAQRVQPAAPDVNT